MTETRKIRTGFVLAGGGAKGAYAAGFVGTLQKHGVKVDAVAGTSVGALNALLVAKEDPETLLREWHELKGPDDVMRTKAKFATSKGATVLLALWVAWLEGTRFPSRILEWPMALMATLPAAALWWGGWWMIAGQAAPLLWTGFVIACWMTLSWLLSYGPPTRREIWVIAPIVHAVLFVLVHLVAAHDVSILSVASWAAFACVPAGFSFGLLLATNFRPSVFDPVGLKERVAKHASGLRCPVWVTTSRHAQWYDPDDEAFVPDYGGGADVPSKYEARPSVGFVPNYERLDPAKPEDIVRACAASAAIPHGIYPSVDGMVDGGTVDNVPYFPLIGLVDVVVVVRLNNSADDHCPDGEEALKARWSELDRLARVTTHGHVPKDCPYGEDPPESIHNAPPRVVPLRAPTSWPKFIVITPDEKLGGLFAMLDFRPTRIAQLIAAGAAKAIAVLPSLKKSIEEASVVSCQPAGS